MTIGGGGTVGTGYVKIKPDAEGFGQDLEQQVGKEATGASGEIGKKASRAFQGAFLAGAATIGKGVFDFANFDAGMREVFTLMPSITAEATDKMTADVKSFAGEFGVLPTEVIPALYSSISAGVPPDNVFAFLETSQKLAKAGATDLATAVDGLSSVTNAYGTDILSASEASDILFTSVKLGKTTVDEMSASLFQVAPIASSFGVSFGEVSASIATLTSQGTPTAVAATQMKAAISELGKEGTKASDSFAEIAGKTFPEFVAEGGTMTDALSMMKASAEENGSSLVDMFGSIEAGQAALGITKDLEKTNANLLAMSESAGATDVAFETMNEGLAATMDRLRAKFSVVLIDLGDSLAPTLETIGESIALVIEAFTALPAPMRTAIVVGGTLLAGLAAFAGPILKAIQLFRMLGGVMTLLAMNPWMLAVLALVAVTYVIIRNWDTVKAALAATFAWIEEASIAVAEFFVNLWQSVSDSVTEKWNAITGAVTGAVDWITQKVSDAWNTVRAVTSEVWNSVSSTVTNVVGGVVSFVTGIPDRIRAAFGGLADAISAPFRTGFGAIKTVWNSTVGGFGFTTPTWVPGFGGKGWTIPKMATGGVAEIPMIAQIGDAGAGDPEVVSPVSLMRSTMIEAIEQTGTGGGLTVNGPLIGQATIRDDRDVVTLSRELAREVEKRQRSAGLRRGAGGITTT